MDASSAAALRGVWADATPLAKYLEDRTEQIRLKKSKAAPSAASADKPTTWDRIAALAQFQLDQDTARKQAAIEIRNNLIAGRLIGIGHAPNSGDFERIDPSVWVDGQIDWQTGTVGRAEKMIVEVRVVTPEAVQASPPMPQSGPGRPSESQIIREAIADYARSDPALKASPFERFRAYRAYISSRGYDPRRDKGFSEKTFEKYENEYRLKFR